MWSVMNNAHPKQAIIPAAKRAVFESTRATTPGTLSTVNEAESVRLPTKVQMTIMRRSRFSTVWLLSRQTLQISIVAMSSMLKKSTAFTVNMFAGTLCLSNWS